MTNKRPRGNRSFSSAQLSWRQRQGSETMTVAEQPPPSAKALGKRKQQDPALSSSSINPPNPNKKQRQQPQLKAVQKQERRVTRSSLGGDKARSDDANDVDGDGSFPPPLSPVPSLSSSQSSPSASDRYRTKPLPSSQNPYPPHDTATPSSATRSSSERSTTGHSQCTQHLRSRSIDYDTVTGHSCRTERCSSAGGRTAKATFS